MEFQDFPMFLGKSGKYEIHPPKLCAGISATSPQRHHVQVGTRFSGDTRVGGRGVVCDEAFSALSNT